MEKKYSLEEMQEPSGTFEVLCKDDKKNDTDYNTVPAWFIQWCDEMLLDYPVSHLTQGSIDSKLRSGELSFPEPAFAHPSPELPSERYVANDAVPVSDVTQNRASIKPPFGGNDKVLRLQNSIMGNGFPGPLDTSHPLPHAIGISYQIAQPYLLTMDTIAVPVSSVTKKQVPINPPFDQKDEVCLHDSSPKDDLPGAMDTTSHPAQVVSGSHYHIAYGKPFTVAAPASGSTTPSKSARTKRYYKTKLNHQCPMCDKAFPSMYAQSIHMRSHTGERPFKCDICDQKFIRKHNLKAHMRVHDTSSQFSCPRCNMSFRRKNCRDIHVISSTCTRWTRHILDSPNEFVCLTCSKGFKDHNRLLHHVQQHNRGLGVFCPVCAISFNGVKGHVILRHVRSTHPDYMASLNLD